MRVALHSIEEQNPAAEVTPVNWLHDGQAGDLLSVIILTLRQPAQILFQLLKGHLMWRSECMAGIEGMND